MEISIKMKRIISLFLLVAFAVLFSFNINTVAADQSHIYVNLAGDDSWNGEYATWQNTTYGPKLTIKNATATVSDGGTVHIANGTYNENGISVYNKNVNFVGENKDKTIINGTNSGRILTLGAQGGSYSLTNLTLTNGKASGGGAIWNSGSVTIDNCVFSYNNGTTAAGGAIYNVGTMSSPVSLTITNSKFIGNTASIAGAITNGLGTLSVTGCNFEGNVATSNVYGKLIWNNYGTISTFQFNRIIGTGTLIYSDSGGDLSLNWWGSNTDPSSKVNGVNVGPWLVLSASSNPQTVGQGAKSTITTDLQHDSGIITDPTNPDLYYHDPTNGHVPNGIPVSFTPDTKGTVNPSIANTLNGAASTTFIAGPNTGTSTITITLDNQQVTSNVNIKDTTPPIVTSVNPANNAVNVPINTIIKVTFNKTIKAGSMWIELQINNGTLIPIKTSISGSILTITPLSLLATGTKYIIAIHTGSVTDLSGNPVAAFFSRFYTAEAPLVVTSVNPANNAVNVPINTIIKVTFNKTIKAGSMWINLQLNDGKLVPIKTSISNNVLTITPLAFLAKGTKYIIAIHTGSVTDLSGNPVAAFFSRFYT